MQGRKIVIFSDLDGTLLDHETYSHEAAMPALLRVRELHIPLVLASSKTAAEIGPLRRELGFEHCPAIVENGSGLLDPSGTRCPVPLKGRQEDQNGRYEELLEKLNQLPPRLRSGFEGFSQWSVAEIAARTGLSEELAALAKRRQFSEPGIWSAGDGKLEEFLQALMEKGMSATRGGRFLTLSFGGNKAEQMLEVIGKFAPERSDLFVIALGDAPNDAGMLAQADLAVIVTNPGGSSPDLNGIETRGEIVTSTRSGPEGWNEVILDVLNKDKAEQNAGKVPAINGSING